jgi:hypothetical protein
MSRTPTTILSTANAAWPATHAGADYLCSRFTAGVAA